MKAKYDYRVAIQEARAIRCSKLEELEAAYLEALSENHGCKVPSMCNTLQGTCKTYV